MWTLTLKSTQPTTCDKNRSRNRIIWTGLKRDNGIKTVTNEQETTFLVHCQFLVSNLVTWTNDRDVNFGSRIFTWVASTRYKYNTYLRDGVTKERQSHQRFKTGFDLASALKSSSLALALSVNSTSVLCYFFISLAINLSKGLFTRNITVTIKV